MPKRGSITGAHLLMLQGMVCILKEQNSLLSQTQAILTASSSGHELAGLFDAFTSTPVLTPEQDGLSERDEPENSARSVPSQVLPSAPCFDSMGLW